MSGIIVKSVNEKKITAIAEQGATWILYLHLVDDEENDIDLTNYSVRSHIRKKFTDTNPTAIFNCSIINAEQGKIQLKLDANITKTIQKGTYVFDVEIENDEGMVTRILEGILIVTPEVTKE